MSETRPELHDQAPEGGDGGEARCYGHPGTTATLRCSRCERPICGRCAIPAAVGQHCPECVAEARKGQRKVRSAMLVTAPVTVGIIAVTVIFFIAQQLLPGLTRSLALFPPAIHSGEWYRLFTPMLLHGGILHIGFNMYALWIFGPSLEEVFGRLRYLAFYVITGFVASATSYAFGPANILGVGASGAIFGVVGVLVVYLYRRRSQQFVASYLRQLWFILAINLVLGLAVPGIDIRAHLGGFAAGLLMGFGFDKPNLATKNGLQLLTTVVVVAIGIALVVWRSATFGA